jgi:uncharacterized protein YggE
VCAQEQSSVPYITVAGSAEVWVEPDAAVWSVRLETSGKDLGELQRENDGDLERLLELTSSNGIPADAVTCGRITVAREYEHEKYGRGDFKGFQLTRIVEFEQHDVSQYEQLLRQLMGEGDFLATPQFKYSAEDSVQAQVHLKAVKNARTKAVAMATVLDSEIGFPLIISEYPIVTDYQHVAELSRESGVILRAKPQRIRIRSTVYVRFEVKPGESGS